MEEVRHNGYSGSCAETLRSGLYDIPAHRLRTYPGGAAEAKAVVEAIRAACPGMADMIDSVDLSRKSGAWNDAKISEHHAIIPTVRSPKEGSITDTERKIYELICVRYVLQFLPEYEYEETTIEFKAGKELFRSTGRTVVDLGW